MCVPACISRQVLPLGISALWISVHLLKKKRRKKNTKTTAQFSANIPQQANSPCNCEGPTSMHGFTCITNARILHDFLGPLGGGTRRSTRPTVWCSLDAGRLLRRCNATMHACSNEYARLPLQPIPAAVSSGGKQTLLDKPRHVCAGEGRLRKCRVR